MKKPTRCLVMIVFFGWLCSSIAVVPRIEIGLDQDLSMPEDSFVLKYFQFLKSYLSIGPPMYFVVKDGLNYSNYQDQNLICGGQYCDLDSLSTQVYLASKTPETSYVAKPSSSWLDDYFDWSAITSCCKVKNGSFCPHTDCKLATQENNAWVISMLYCFRFLQPVQHNVWFQDAPAYGDRLWPVRVIFPAGQSGRLVRQRWTRRLRSGRELSDKSDDSLI